MARLLRSDRRFRRFWVGQTVNNLGSTVSTLALPLVAVDRLHASTLMVALLEAVEWLPALLIGLFVGVLVDRRAPRSLMIGANLGQALAIGSVPLAAALGVLSLPLLLGATALAGLVGVFFQGAYSPYVRFLVATDDLVEANSRLQASQSLASVSGPSLGGALVQTLSAATAVMLDAASFLVSALFLWLSGPVTTNRAGSAPKSIGKEISEGTRYLVTSPALLTLTGVTTIANLFLSAIGAIEIVFLVRVVGLPAGLVGVLFTVGGAGGLLAALMGRRAIMKVGTRRTARFGLLFSAPFSLFLPLAHPGSDVAFFAFGSFLVTFGIVIESVAVITMRQSLCPVELVGRVGGASRLATSASVPLGALIGGVLGQEVGTRAAMAILAAGYVFAGLAVAMSPLRRAPDEERTLRTSSQPGAGASSVEQAEPAGL
jgi:predicted MFS family arabinose efflux permease